MKPWGEVEGGAPLYVVTSYHAYSDSSKHDTQFKPDAPGIFEFVRLTIECGNGCFCQRIDGLKWVVNFSLINQLCVSSRRRGSPRRVEAVLHECL
jgi:hypothetical protein